MVLVHHAVVVIVLAAVDVAAVNLGISGSTGDFCGRSIGSNSRDDGRT